MLKSPAEDRDSEAVPQESKKKSSKDKKEKKKDKEKDRKVRYLTGKIRLRKVSVVLMPVFIVSEEQRGKEEKEETQRSGRGACGVAARRGHPIRGDQRSGSSAHINIR